MSMHTSRYTLDNTIDSGGGDVYIPNPHSWTQLGNLLYIDARQAGFSYNIMSDARSLNNESVRFQEFNSQNFNPFFDGADFIRVLLRFLARHPELQSNPVVIVGESYGGMRAICMLHLLLNYTDYAGGQAMYQDRALVAEIQAHYDKVFPQYQGQVVPPEVITSQFAHFFSSLPSPTGISLSSQRNLRASLVPLLIRSGKKWEFSTIRVFMTMLFIS
jgi:hypothetical protein